jgi:plasmid maintenance system antidote protein VapI
MSVRNKMRPVHPGEVLRDELDALKMSVQRQNSG